MLLIIALVLMVVASVLHRRAMHRLGRRLAEDNRKLLERNTRNDLKILAQDSGAAIALVREKLEMAVRIQVCEVEKFLGMAPPLSPTIYFSKDYDEGTRLPQGMVISDKHFRRGTMSRFTRLSVRATWLAPDGRGRVRGE